MSLPPIQLDWSQEGSYWFDLWDQSPRDQLFAAGEVPKVGTKLSDDAAMFLACCAAIKGAGSVSPNPLVGAVVLDRKGLFIGVGAHLKVGGAHAEVNALDQVADKALLEGGTIFVTLEPCAHVGRTPSCAQMLATTGLSRIVYAVKDPNPLVNGAGHSILEASGKIVESAPAWNSRCEWLARVFLHNQIHNDIYTGIKVASTTTGVIAGEGTKRLWITGERAREMGHFLRLEYDAIVVGIQTFLLDDPSLNVRHSSLKGRTPLRVVLDPRDQIKNEKGSFKLFQEDPGKTLVVLPDSAKPEGRYLSSGIKTLQLPLSLAGHFDWLQLKKSLWDMGIRSLLIEGGAGVYQTALSSKAVNAIHWFVAKDQGQQGLRWPMEERFLNAYKNGSGIALGIDRLLEFKL
jgi:diaminohydroxyphosphoribosylaminopyrimidine deaminase/5-amino-6-(5-phosphoribosylamino)uracil reductase